MSFMSVFVVLSQVIVKYVVMVYMVGAIDGLACLAPDLSCFFPSEDENCVEILLIPTLENPHLSSTNLLEEDDGDVLPISGH